MKKQLVTVLQVSMFSFHLVICDQEKRIYCLCGKDKLKLVYTQLDCYFLSFFKWYLSFFFFFSLFCPIHLGGDNMITKQTNSETGDLKKNKQRLL